MASDSSINSFRQCRIVSSFYAWETRTKVEKKQRRLRNPNRNPSPASVRSSLRLRLNSYALGMFKQTQEGPPDWEGLLLQCVSQSGLTLQLQYPWNAQCP